MGRNPKFDSILETMRALHDRKNHDYAQDSNPYSNFEATAATADVPMDKVFLIQIANKIARLNELAKGKTPNNESVNDSRIDLAVYSALYASYFVEDIKTSKKK
ncbi:MAG TPA: hypothetical protein VII94_01365 [Candidatus Saccharimonadales bacterium]